MYVYICVCIHVQECPAYIVCQEYIGTCIYTLPVHLDIILFVVSDGDDSTECWKSLFENPGVIEVHELHEVFVHSEHRGLVHQNVTKRSVSNGDNLIGTTVDALIKFAESNALIDPVKVVVMIGIYPKRARSRSFSMKYVFNAGPMSTTHFSCQVKMCVIGASRP